MRKTVGLVGLFCMVISMQAKTLVAYYSYTSNIHRIVEALVSQIEADVVRIEPAEKGWIMRLTTMRLAVRRLPRC